MAADDDESPAEDTVQRFAMDLRTLRVDAGNPTLKRLASETGISRTVLSEALSGRTLPTARTVAGLVRACGEDTAPWMHRREALAAAAKSAAAPEPQERGAEETGIATAPGISRRAAVGLAAASFLAGAAGTAVAAAIIAPSLMRPAEARSGPRISVENGVDPAQTACLDDAAVATADTRAGDALLEIVWSDNCQAGWGRVTRYDGLGEGNTVTIAIYPETAPDGPDRQEATEHDVQGAYTTLVVRPTPDTLLCAEGRLTIDGTRVDLGEPLCI